jgi:hypothetical protein
MIEPGTARSANATAPKPAREVANHCVAQERSGMSEMAGKLLAALPADLLQGLFAKAHARALAAERNAE